MSGTSIIGAVMVPVFNASRDIRDCITERDNTPEDEMFLFQNWVERESDFF